MATTTRGTGPPDLTAITARQRGVWAGGDYSAVAARIPVISELLCDAADLRAGDRVLDVAGGSGNTALAAARLGARVTSLDYVPSLLERAAERAAAEGLAIDLVEGDAQALPFPDASFDAVISVVGVMFAPDQRRAAAELLRVVRPGGTIALASWTPGGFIGGLLRTVGAHVPPPAGLAPRPCGGRRRTSATCSAAASARCACGPARTPSGSRRPRASPTSSGPTTAPRSPRSRRSPRTGGTRWPRT